eukprot:g44665.t1
MYGTGLSGLRATKSGSTDEMAEAGSERVPSPEMKPLHGLFLLLMIVACSSKRIQDAGADGVFDLFDITGLTRKNVGVHMVKGPEASSPAYRILNPDLIAPASENSFSELIDHIQQEKGFIFLATLRQIKKSRGTLVAIDTLQGTRIFEILSNGKANTLDLTITIDGKQSMVSITDAHLANTRWKNLTLFVQEDVATLYVGCEKVNGVELEEAIHKVLKPGDYSLRLAKGGPGLRNNFQ